jgi:hypothetical protein
VISGPQPVESLLFRHGVVAHQRTVSRVPIPIAPDSSALEEVYNSRLAAKKAMMM